MLSLDVKDESVNTVIKSVMPELLQFSRRPILGQSRSLGCSNLLRDLSQLPLRILSQSSQPGDLHHGVIPVSGGRLPKPIQLILGSLQFCAGDLQLSRPSLRHFLSLLLLLLHFPELLLHMATIIIPLLPER